MKKRYPIIFLAAIASAAVFTGCGVDRTVQQPQQTDTGSAGNEAALQEEIDALQQELDALKNAQNQQSADNTQATDNADTAQTGGNSTAQTDNTQSAANSQNAGNTGSTGSAGNTGSTGSTGSAGNTGSSRSYGNVSDVAISLEEAQNIALERVPGATAQNMAIGLDFDDGWYTYEGDILYNRVEYEFEIDANTGKILKWEEERW